MLFKYISKSRNQIKPLLLLVLSLLVIITLLGNSGIIKHFNPAVIASYFLLRGDLNLDNIIDVNDVVLYNIYLKELEKNLPVDTIIIKIMDYNIEIKPSCKKDIKKACKKNALLRKALENKINQIITQPFHYKPLKHELFGERRIHILKSFVLVFEIDYTNRTVVFLRFKHHDDVYGR